MLKMKCSTGLLATWQLKNTNCTVYSLFYQFYRVIPILPFLPVLLLEFLFYGSITTLAWGDKKVKA